MSPTKHDLVLQRQEANAHAADLQAQLRDAQGQVAALAKRAESGAGGAQCLLCGTEPDLGVWEHEEDCPVADLPAASKAILAAAEREQGMREALKEAMRRFGAIDYLANETYVQIENHSLLEIGQIVGDGERLIDVALAQEGESTTLPTVGEDGC